MSPQNITREKAPFFPHELTVDRMNTHAVPPATHTHAFFVHALFSSLTHFHWFSISQTRELNSRRVLKRHHLVFMAFRRSHDDRVKSSCWFLMELEHKRYECLQTRCRGLEWVAGWPPVNRAVNESYDRVSLAPIVCGFSDCENMLGEWVVRWYVCVSFGSDICIEHHYKRLVFR